MGPIRRRGLLATGSRALRGARTAWNALQIELNGRYSLPRIRHLHAFYRTTSTAYSLLLCLGTLLPCPLIAMAMDWIPLDDPAHGLGRSGTVWIRAWLVGFLAAFSAAGECRMVAPSMGFTTKSVLGSALLVASTYTTTQYVLARAIGFPLPFSFAVAIPGIAPAVAAACYAVAGNRLWRNKDLRAEARRFVLLLSCEVSQLVIYPLNIFVLGKLQALAQTVFVCLLPLIRIGIKNLMSHILAGLDDVKPVAIIFNAHIFVSFYSLFAMQSANSANTTLVVVGMQVANTCSLIWDINQMIRSGEAIMKNAKVLDHMTDRSIIDVGIEILDGPHVMLERRTTSGGIQVLVGTKKYSSNKVVAGTTTNELFVRLQHARSLRSVDPREPVKMWASSPVPHRSPCQLDRLNGARHIAKLLFMVEYSLLLAYLDSIVPIIYCALLLIRWYLPNRPYYPDLADFTKAGLHHAVYRGLQITVLQVASLAVVGMIFRHKLKISPIRQLGFVLQTQAGHVHTKVVTWALYAVTASLTHFGTFCHSRN